ncbi:GntR family transcriptional regulator [Corynebacterium sp. MSK072]|uniref:GntR family transcriptional regulator n=1 Tax=Corynebacterium rhinophilum TaxID=3050197 RepID=UPI00254B3795|nr:GntR family transcriptional regulator [Corynebacterium sp. MSK072]MDK8829554.1 GntR family transcriptional regulator [Corynebacterium sp. MSK072]
MSDTSMQPAAERVYELVKERIIDGTIDSSQMLSEAALAAEVGVSRTPAHEAFLRLELEGFLQLYPKRGALVVPISPQEIREVYEARLLVDAHSAEKICELGEEERGGIAKRLHENIAAQDAALDAEDLREYTRLDAQFHQIIMDSAGNSLLANVGHQLRERQQRFTATAIGRNVARARAFVDQHRTLADALRTANLPDYLSALRSHLKNSKDQL